MLAMRSTDQVAQIAMLLARDEPLILQPKVVVEFADVTIAGVTSESHHALRLLLFAAIAQCGGQQRARGRTGHDAFATEERPRGRERFAVRNGIGAVRQREIA